MGEHGRGWGERRGGGGGGGGRPPPPPPPPPSQALTQPPAKKRKFSFESSDESDDGAIPRAKKPPPRTAYEGRPRPQTRQPPQDRHRPPPPPTTKTDTPKTSRRSDRWDSRPRALPHRGREGHRPRCPWAKYGAVWVEYLAGTTLYEVSRSLLFPTLEEAERCREEARAGKKKPKLPAPTNEESNPPNANPTTEPTNPTNPTNPPSGPVKMWDPTRGSHEV